MASFNITPRNGNTYTVLVDDEDLARVLATGPWQIRTWRGLSYAYNQRVALHRSILKVTGPGDVDHIDGNSLNNRKGNLRLCTHAENLRNRGKTRASTSGYKGVTWNKKIGKWHSQIMVHYKNHNLGNFDTPEQAYAVYCAAAVRLHKDFARFD